MGQVFLPGRISQILITFLEDFPAESARKHPQVTLCRCPRIVRISIPGQRWQIIKVQLQKSEQVSAKKPFLCLGTGSFLSQFSFSPLLSLFCCAIFFPVCLVPLGTLPSLLVSPPLPAILFLLPFSERFFWNRFTRTFRLPSSGFPSFPLVDPSKVPVSMELRKRKSSAFCWDPCPRGRQSRNGTVLGFKALVEQLKRTSKFRRLGWGGWLVFLGMLNICWDI